MTLSSDGESKAYLCSLAEELGGQVFIEDFGIYFQSYPGADDQLIGKDIAQAVKVLERRKSLKSKALAKRAMTNNRLN